MHRPRRRLALVAALALPAGLLPLGLAGSASAVPGADSSVFINEIHYDNVGTDVDEFVEIANPTSRDLTGWSVVLYNGNPATAAETYGTTATLTGSAPFQVVDYPANGLQNGAPDGLALVDAGGALVQLLSYEGGLTASGGPADGQTSTDIGVTEAGTEPAGQSLQLEGSGATAGAFTWTGPVTATPGAANAGQAFGAPDDAPLTVANPSPLTQAQGTTAAYTVTATDTDDTVAVVVGSTPAGVTATVAGAGTSSATVTVEVSGTAAAGTVTVPITFSTSAQSIDSPLVVEVQSQDACGALATREIAEVQGSGATSPLDDQEVRVEGVVVGDFQDAGQFGGFYVQDVTPDGDPLTSDGLRVFNNATAVSVGDLVRVTGTVDEFASSSNLYSGSETQLSGSTVTVCGTAALPAPAAVTLPFAGTVDGVAGQERFEGTLATLTQTDLVATDLFTLGRFGEVSLTSGELLYIPTTAQEDADNNRDRLTLDDGLAGQNLSPLPYTIAGDGVTLPRAGDTLAEPATGVLTYAFGEYRLEPPVGTTLDFARTNPRDLAPDDVGGDVQVASFNVLNYFVAFGGDNRGADNAAELVRQQEKLVSAITALDADVVGLIEIANDDGTALDTLVAALNDAQPEATDDYTAVQAPDLTPANSLGGTYGTDAIRTAIIYRASVVTPAGPPPSSAALLNPADPLFPAQPVFDRPPAVQEFTPVEGERSFTVLVNHFKSKGSTNEQCGTPDPFGGNCDDLRERQSAALLELVDDLGAEDAMLLGDFNSYEQEAPIAALEAGGFTSSVADQPREDRSSYSFDGEFGSLDYVFVSASLLGALTGADIWQINSLEAVALDYNSFNQPQLYAPGPFASSDHDPLVVGLELVEDVAEPVAPGYSLVEADGDVSGFGGGLDLVGEAGDDLVDAADNPAGGSYLLQSDGTVVGVDDAPLFGDVAGLALNGAPIDLIVTASGQGYWVLAADGGVFSFGDAQFYGSTGDLRLNAPVVGGAATATGRGYWLFAADGGVFAFGDAEFYGSTGGLRLNAPVVDGVGTAAGYLLVATDGGVFAFGDAVFSGSTGSLSLNAPVVDLGLDPDGEGYWLAAADGGVFSFDAPFFGSLGSAGADSPVVAILVEPGQQVR